MSLSSAKQQLAQYLPPHAMARPHLSAESPRWTAASGGQRQESKEALGLDVHSLASRIPSQLWSRGQQTSRVSQ